MNTIKSLCTFFSLILFSLPGLVQADSVIEQLKSLSDQHKYEQAYQLASEHREQYEGDLDFDFMYGVSAIDTGHVNEGVFALERVVFSQPKNHLARLELARGYFMQGDDVRSRQEFDKVLKIKPPASVVKIVDKFIAAIRIRESQYKTSATAYFDIEIGGDSNVNAGPERNKLGKYDSLDESKSENNDSYATYSFGGKLNHPVTPHRSMFLNADASIRRNSEETVNNNEMITIQGGTQWQKERSKYKLSLIGQQYVLNKSVNRNLFGISFEKVYSSLKLQQLTLSASLMDIQYLDSPLYDSNQFTLALSSFSKGAKISWYGGANTGVQASKDRTNSAKSVADRFILGGNIGSLVAINNRSNIDINLMTNMSKFSAAYLYPSDPKRKDTYSKAALTYNYLINDQWKYRVGLNYSQNNSNVEIFAYKRSQLLIGFQRVF